jgi:hypothetical protein
MPPPDATLTIAVEADPAASGGRTLVLRCPHAVTTLPLPGEAAAAAERAATTLAILQHYSRTACACGCDAR